MSNKKVSPPMSPSDRIRQLWPDFKQTASKNRTLMEKKLEALLDKAEKDYEKAVPERRPTQDQHAALKEKLTQQTTERHFEIIREQWEEKLNKLGLRMDDWDVSAEEMLSVVNVLGNPETEATKNDVFVARPAVPTYATTSAQPLAPSLSSSTRSTNVSTASSYALVDPSEFNSEEEDTLFFQVATSYDLTSDDDDGPTRRPRQNGFDAWSSDSSSHHSFDASSSARFPSVLPQPMSSRKMSSAAKHAASLKERDHPIVSKSKQPYVGPVVHDPDESLSEEEDFERFKMNIRFQKIVEFHQAAAQADIQLAIAVYKDRKAQNSDTHEVSSKVNDHQMRMMQLQMEKEEERKNIVKAERSKRRSELRRRPGRSGTLIAPIPSLPANPAWLNAFQEQVTEEVASDIVLDKILSTDPDEQEGNVERLLQGMFPGSSTMSQNHSVVQNGDPHVSSFGWASSSSSSPNVDSTIDAQLLPNGMPHVHNSTFRNVNSLFGEDPDSNQAEDSNPAPPPSHSTNPFMNEDTGAFLSNQLMADPEFLSLYNQWGATGELPSHPPPSTSTWGVSGQPPPTLSISEPSSHAPSPCAWGMRQLSTGDFPSQTPSASAWGMRPTAQSSTLVTEIPNQLPARSSWSSRQSVQTPTVDNPNPWKAKDIPSTPLAAGVANRRKTSFSASQASPLQNSFVPFNATERAEVSVSLAAKAAFNSANAKEKHLAAMVGGDRKSVAEDTIKKSSPPNSTPAPAPPPSTSTRIATQPKVENSIPAPPPHQVGKKLNKKQRQAMKKIGAVSTAAEPEDADKGLEESTPTTAGSVLDQVTEPEPPVTAIFNSFGFDNTFSGNVNRVRRDSTSAWGELLSTPRPASKIPSHFQGMNGIKSEEASRPGANRTTTTTTTTEPFRSSTTSSNTSTIKASSSSSSSSPRGSGLKAGTTSRSVLGMFSSSDAGPSRLQTAPPIGRDPRMPGGFDGNADVGEDDIEPLFAARLSTRATSSQNKSPMSAAQQQQQQRGIHIGQPNLRTNGTASSSSSSAAAAAAPTSSKSTPASSQPQSSVPSPSGNNNNKKGKNKKGKGRIVTVEEVADDDEDSRGGCLPPDSRYIMESNLDDDDAIVGPKPKVPPTMYGSIIGYSDEDDDAGAEGESTTSSATPLSSATSSSSSSSSSSPPGLFDGNSARLAAAIKEIQEGTARMERQYAGTPWGGFGGGGGGVAGPGPGAAGAANKAANNNNNAPLSTLSRAAAVASEPETPLLWGRQHMADDKKKLSVAPPPTTTTTIINPGENLNNMFSKQPAAAAAFSPAIQNLKRSKAAAGGKLF